MLVEDQGHDASCCLNNNKMEAFAFGCRVSISDYAEDKRAQTLAHVIRHSIVESNGISSNYGARAWWIVANAAVNKPHASVE